MKRRKKSNQRDDRPVYTRIESPFGDLSADELNALRERAAENASERYRADTERLVEILGNYNPVVIVSMLARYGTTCVITNGDRVKGQESSFDAITQAHVEFLLGLVAVAIAEGRMETENLGNVPDEIVSEVWQLLPAIFRNYSLKQLNNVRSAKEEDRELVMVQQLIRIHTLSVRNWGTYEQVKRICRELYEEIDDAIEKELGFTASNAISVFEGLVKLSEDRMNHLMKRMRNVFKARNLADLAKRFCREFDEIKDTSGLFLKYLVKNEFDMDSARRLCVAYLNDQIVPRENYFSVSEVAEECRLQPDLVRRLFQSYSLSDNDLQNCKLESLWLANPIWDKPLIAVGSDLVFAPVSFRFFHDPKKMIESRVKSEALKVLVSSRRAAFLERSIGDLFKRNFQSAIVGENFALRFEGQEYETDLLVQIDTCLFVVEAKSGVVSLPALRGAPDRIRREVKKLIEEPSTQSSRFVSILQNYKAKGTEIQFISDAALFDFDCVKRIVRLSVTLDDFATVQSQIGSLYKAGILNKNVRVAPTMIFADLEMVCDLLEDPALKVHYLFRRGEVQGKLLAMAHEAEWLQFYLNTGFNVGDFEETDEEMMFPYGSQLIDDHYHLSESVGVLRRKPKPQISKYWLTILSMIRQRGFQGWTEAAYILLNLSLEEQDMVEVKLKGLKKTVPRDLGDPDHQNSIVVIPRKERRDAVAFIVFDDSNYEKRRKMSQNISDRAFENEHVKRCLVIGKRVSAWSMPYETLGIFYCEGGDAVQSF